MAETKKILIVDDEAPMRSALRRLLADDDRYYLEEACDGFDAEEKIREFLPDLVILDVKMPRHKYGHEICLHIKNNPLTKHIKVVALSGFEGDINRTIMVERCGADCFFEKPFDNNEFKKKISELLCQEKTDEK